MKFLKKNNLHHFFLVLVFGFGLLVDLNPSISYAQQVNTSRTVYLPLVARAPDSFSTNQKFLGIYMQQYWTDETVLQYMTQADNLAGKKHTVSGWFIAIEDGHFNNPPSRIQDNNLYRQLEALWQRGYISFVNINSSASAFSIAVGQFDRNIEKMAEVYAAWASLGGGRRAFLAPLPEMNGVNEDGKAWATYGGDPGNFKIAYQRIQTIFSQKGVRAEQVWWVFAPNGWSKKGHEFETYYPVNSAVNAVGFSSYNYGHCFVAAPWQRWENFDTLFTPYLDRIRVMAPNKPIILAQTGTTAEFSRTGENNISQKNTWLKVNYQHLAQQPQVVGIIYYDFDLSAWECNWRILPGTTYSGYRDGAGDPAFRYLTHQDLRTMIP
ncbi:MAG: hypothetical protein AB1453_01780 [Chloroflexota bacterium]